jgi:hypothetical protein
MNTRAILATTTALGLLAATGAAMAVDPNTAYISQSGTGNQSTVQQNAGPGGNDVGLSGAPVRQQGDNNKFNELQFTGGGFSNGDNDIIALKQLGDSNVFGSSYSNNAGGNRIVDALQQGNLNWVSVGRNASMNGIVSGLKIVGNSNSAQITQQSGSGNTVTLLQITGDSNEVAYGSGGPQNANQWAAAILQSGNSNLVTEASITGSSNTGNGSVGPLKITQNGNNNGQSFSVARIRGSVGNYIIVNEQGNSNNFSVLQGVNTASTGNHATVNQIGNSNQATATQFGSLNQLVIQQNADNNIAVANFTGDSNGNGSLTGIAAALLPSNANLVEGTIYQDSTGSLTGNTVTYNVNGDGNLFAMAQIGGSNTITGTVSSDNNQAAILQTGNGNVTNFTQSGGNNNAISVSQ